MANAEEDAKLLAEEEGLDDATANLVLDFSRRFVFILRRLAKAKVKVKARAQLRIRLTLFCGISLKGARRSFQGYQWNGGRGRKVKKCSVFAEGIDRSAQYVDGLSSLIFFRSVWF